MTQYNKILFGLLLVFCAISIVSADTNVTPLPQTTYSIRYLNPFMNVSWDFAAQAPILIAVYGDTFGNNADPTTYAGNGNTIVIGSWFLLLIALYWLRQEDIVIPMLMTIILANIAFWTPGMIPEDWKYWLIVPLIVIPIGAIIYSLVTER